VGENAAVESESLRGHLLVAGPKLLDPNFLRTVVLVGEHGEEGALGVVLNRPSDARVAEAVPALAQLVEEDAVVHVGGPVQPEAVTVLAEFSERGQAATTVFGRVGFARGDLDVNALATGTPRARVFAGYAGWSAGQLEGELAGGDWILADPLADDVFSSEGLGLWATVLRRKGGHFELLARMPIDPSLN